MRRSTVLMTCAQKESHLGHWRHLDRQQKRLGKNPFRVDKNPMQTDEKLGCFPARWQVYRYLSKQTDGQIAQASLGWLFQSRISTGQTKCGNIRGQTCEIVEANGTTANIWADLRFCKALISNYLIEALQTLKSAHFDTQSLQIWQWKIDSHNPTVS